MSFPVLSQVIEAGANAIVAGSAVFKAKSYKDGECMGTQACDCTALAAHLRSPCM